MDPAKRPCHKIKDRPAAEVMLIIRIIIVDVFSLLSKVGELLLYSLSPLSPKCNLWRHNKF